MGELRPSSPVAFATSAAASSARPHFVWIVADDLGTFDVPFTNYAGSEVRAPTLGRLAANGLTLDSYYVQPLCTPSRAAFMTGRHPVSLGLQHGVILGAEVGEDARGFRHDAVGRERSLGDRC